MLYLRDPRRLRADEHAWRIRFPSARSSLEFLQRSLPRGGQGAARATLARCWPELPVSRMTDGEVLERLATLVDRGRLAMIVPRYAVHWVPNEVPEEHVLGPEVPSEREWIMVDARHEDEEPPAMRFDDDVQGEETPTLAVDDAAADDPPPVLLADDRPSGDAATAARGGKEGRGVATDGEQPEPTLAVDDDVLDVALETLSFDDVVVDNRTPSPASPS